MQTTMQQVADAAGVHRTTVSLALRHHPSIPETTRLRIMQAAEKLGYRPNPLVSTLMSQLRSQRRRGKGSHEIIGFINNYPPSRPFEQISSLLEMFQGAQKRAEELGFVLQVFDLQAPDMSAERLQKILRSRGIRALIIGTTYEKTTLPINIDHFAVVALGSSLSSPTLERIASDHHQCMQVAFSQCLQHGYRRIGLVLPEHFSTRLEGRWEAAFLYSQPQLPATCRIPPLRQTSDSDLKKWMERHKPEVLISPASNIWRTLQTCGSGIPIANLTRVSGDIACAGIDQHLSRVGRISAERVVSRLHQNDFGPLEQAQTTLLHGTWVDGPSLPVREKSL